MNEQNKEYLLKTIERYEKASDKEKLRIIASFVIEITDDKFIEENAHRLSKMIEAYIVMKKIANQATNRIDNIAYAELKGYSSFDDPGCEVESSSQLRIAVMDGAILGKASLEAAIRAASELDGVEIVDGSDPSIRKTLEEKREEWDKVVDKVISNPKNLREDKNKDQFGTYKKRKWR